MSAEMRHSAETRCVSSLPIPSPPSPLYTGLYLQLLHPFQLPDYECLKKETNTVVPSMILWWEDAEQKTAAGSPRLWEIEKQTSETCLQYLSRLQQHGKSPEVSGTLEKSQISVTHLHLQRGTEPDDRCKSCLPAPQLPTWQKNQPFFKWKLNHSPKLCSEAEILKQI